MRTLSIGLMMVGALCGACGGDDGTGSMAMATSAISGFMGGTVTGTATFVEGAADTASDSVTVTITLNMCTAGKAYPVHIHTGGDCTDMSTQMGHWDMTRGEGIPDVMCMAAGHTASGTVTYNRTATDTSLAWSVGGSATTDVIGHSIVVHDPDMPMNRIACGVITGG